MESRLHVTRHPLASRSNSSSQVPNDSNYPVFSHACRSANEPVYGDSDVNRGQKVNFDSVGHDRGHCVKKSRLSLEIEPP